MNGGLSKLGTALIAVFAVCLLILVADLFYVLLRRRRFQRRSAAAGDSSSSSSSSSPLYVLSSKELLYFFCWKNQSARIEPNEASTTTTNTTIDIDCPDHHDRDRTAEIDDVMKIHDGMYGPSRLLFTIREEEEVEYQRSTADGLGQIMDGTITTGNDDVDEAVAVAVAVELDDATPFSTPCGSPPYYTPSPSPSREELKSTTIHENYGVSASREEIPFASLEIIGV